jgi:hypothetical protein
MKERIVSGAGRLLIVALVLGSLCIPMAFADIPASMQSASHPVWLTLSTGQMPTIGTVTAFGSVKSWTPTSQLEYSNVVSADGVINHFEYSFHYEG